jgi:hypothetical protein
MKSLSTNGLVLELIVRPYVLIRALQAGVTQII